MISRRRGLAVPALACSTAASSSAGSEADRPLDLVIVSAFIAASSFAQLRHQGHSVVAIDGLQLDRAQAGLLQAFDDLGGLDPGVVGAEHDQRRAFGKGTRADRRCGSWNRSARRACRRGGRTARGRRRAWPRARSGRRPRSRRRRCLPSPWPS